MMEETGLIELPGVGPDAGRVERAKEWAKRHRYPLLASLACLLVVTLAVAQLALLAMRDTCASLGMSCVQLLLRELTAMLPHPFPSTSRLLPTSPGSLVSPPVGIG